MQQKFDDFKALSDTKIEGLKKDKRRLCRYIANVSQAVSVLGHETCKNEKFFVDLTAEQRSLVLGVVDFCWNVENEYGISRHCGRNQKNGGMSEKIFKEYKLWCDFFCTK